MNQQLDLFTFSLPKYEFDKPIRLIELFAGIGSQLKAFKILGANVENYKTCEWAMNSIIGYNAIHYHITEPKQLLDKTEVAKKLFEMGVSLDYNKPATLEQLKRVDIRKLNLCYEGIQNTHNLVNIMNVKGRDLDIVDTDNYDYVLTYSFPCQDLSLAGKREGMSVSQADGGTRSGLLWEVERILCELDYEHRPQILLMENVKEVIGSGAIEDFKKWRYKLETLGYSNFCEVLNGKDYAIPQNRQRAFMVSIKGEYSYQFPYKMELKYRLKDFLEKEVDEKYYLSQKMIQYITATNDKWKGNNSEAIVNRDVGCTINTAPTQRRCNASNYICDELPVNTDLRKDIKETLENNKIEVGDFIDTYNRSTRKGICATITTRVNDSNESFVCVREGDGISLFNSEQYGGDKFYDQCSPTIKASKVDTGVLNKNNTEQGYLVAHNGDGINICGRMEHQRGNVQDGMALTINTKGTDVGVAVGERERERESNYGYENSHQRNVLCLWALKVKITNIWLRVAYHKAVSTIVQGIVSSQLALSHFLAKCVEKTKKQLLRTMYATH